MILAYRIFHSAQVWPVIGQTMAKLHPKLPNRMGQKNPNILVSIPYQRQSILFYRTYST